MDQDQLNYNQFSSKKNANKLTLIVRNGVTRSVEHWAKNHEKRIQLRSKMKKLVSKYPILSGSTLDFSSFLAENNGNRLTANMRNNLLNKIAQISTNHEMRLRELEKQLPQQVFHCVGQYSTGVSRWCSAKKDKGNVKMQIGCFASRNNGPWRLKGLYYCEPGAFDEN